jgi:hypothetical protein
MDSNHHRRLFYPFIQVINFAGILILIQACSCDIVTAQQKTVDGQTYTKYKRAYFTPKRGLNYSLYVAPVLTVDPLGLGGKSTYALSIISRITLWESKLAGQQLQGLRIKGLYTSLGYEYYPQQFDNLYASLWLRVKTFMPIVARMDGLYSFGYGKQGIASRFCFGFEIRKFTVLLSGTIYSASTVKLFGDHPTTDSPYSNAGAIMLLIPVYNHEVKP